MIAYPSLLALAALGASFGVSGLAMLGVPRARPSAVLLVLGGLAVVAAAVLHATGWREEAATAFVAAGGLLTLGVTSYPNLRWRHPVDFFAVLILAGSGVVALAWPGKPDVVSSLGLLAGLVLVAHTWVKVERSTGGDRRALLWMSLAISVAAMVVFITSFLLLGTLGVVISCLLAGTIGPAMYVGVRRPQVVDVRGLVVRVAVFTTATIGYVGLFMTVESLVEILGGAVPPVAALAVVGAFAATTFHPLQVVLRGVLDELLFGARPDPLGAASRVAGHIGDDPALALRAIREALVLPYAALRLNGETVASAGTEVTHLRTMPLSLGGNRAGELIVGLRPGDLGLSQGDQDVLGLVAPLLAQTLRATALADDLRESRGQAVAAIEEERRRLRRDLHDGLGPRLSGIAFTSDAVRNSLRHDPAGAEALLGALRQETVTAIEDIRGLVYAMRPPALDELGLVSALRQHARTLRTPQGAPMRVELDAEPLPPLPAAVDVAAYRIVVEALTNAARHSGSTDAAVGLVMVDGCLHVEVTDHGAAARPWRAGVGMASMRERAAELGGTLSAGGTPNGGRVLADLPIPG